MSNLFSEEVNMYIYSVYDPEFKSYGKVLEGYDTAELVKAMNDIPMPEVGVSYEPSIASLEECSILSQLENRAYGGMPIQIGMCWGHNTKLNCLEYHRDSEINIGAEDFILLLARQGDIVDAKVDTSIVMAFRAPASVPVEVYATSLHYAPCNGAKGQGFRTAIVLPRNTNTDLPDFVPANDEDTWMTARNKWLLAHPESDEAKNGAHIGLCGENIDIEKYI